MAAGLTASWPEAIPLPESVTDMFAVAALLVMATEPVVLPAALGLKSMVSVRLCPGARLVGNVTPVMLKAWPDTVSWEISMVVVCAAPLDKVSDMDFELPTCTLPKLTVEALTDKLPGEVGFDGELGLDGEVGAIFVLTQPKVNRTEKINKRIELHASSENRRVPDWNWRKLMGMHLFNSAPNAP